MTVCRRCHGSGHCATCEGIGEVERFDDYCDAAPRDCEACAATGDCPDCQGDGELPSFDDAWPARPR